MMTLHQRKFNWAIFLSSIGGSLAAPIVMRIYDGPMEVPEMLVISLLGSSASIYMPIVFIMTGLNFAYVLAVYGLYLLYVGSTIREKNRSWAWLLLPALVPWGWIGLLFLKDRSSPHIEGIVKCLYHDDEEAIGNCEKCGHEICEKCIDRSFNNLICTRCAVEERSSISSKTLNQSVITTTQKKSILDGAKQHPNSAWAMYMALSLLIAGDFYVLFGLTGILIAAQISQPDERGKEPTWWIVSLITMIVTCRGVLKDKGRSTWWAAFCLLPLGFIVPWILKSKKTNSVEGEEAVAKYTKSIQADPNDAGAYYKRGNSYKGKGEYATAIADYTKAVEINPQVAEAYHSRGSIWYQKGNYAEGIIDFTKAIELGHQDAETYNSRGFAYSSRGEYDKAIADYNKAIEMKPKDAIAYQLRGVTYYNRGEYDKAIDDYTKAIQLDRMLAKAYNNRGVVYKDKGEYDKAIADHTKAMQLDPKLTKAYNNRGFAYKKKGKYNKAIADYSRAIQLDPKLAKAYNNRGFAYANKGEYDKAIADYTMAIENDPENAVAYNNRGFAYKDKGEYDKAIADYTKAIELDPKDALAYQLRGVAYYNKGEYDKTIDDYSKAIEIDPDHAVTYNNRGAAYDELGEQAKAEADYEKARELGFK